MKRRFRLKRSTEIMRLRRFGNSYAHPLVTLYVLKSEQDVPQVAISAGKMIGNAVMRNRAKRKMRSIMSEFVNELQPGIEIVVAVKRNLLTCNHTDARHEIATLLQKAKLINGNQIHERSDT